MPTLKAAAAAETIDIRVAQPPTPGPWSAPPRPQDADPRAMALVVEAGERVCIVVTDTLRNPDDVLAAAARRIEEQTRIPGSHLLICATHTHHAPCTGNPFTGARDEAFCRELERAIVQAAVDASNPIDQAAGPEADAELLFAESQEATVGMNSRYLLADGTIAWHAYDWRDVVRPTGPYDPDLPVLAFRRLNGELAGVAFNHSVHNIGALTRGAVSPGFYGLAAQELHRRHGAVSLFLPGAFGSTHNTGSFGCTENIHAIPTAESVHRVTEAVETGLRRADPVHVDGVKALKRPFTYRIRTFDEAREEAAVKYWTEKYTPESAQSQQQMWRSVRARLAPVQGEERQTCLQVIRLGDVALVGVPGEMFAALGMEIRRRSPFRYTYIVGLANDTIGYIGDRDSYELGGYQLWAGLHSPSAPGAGEAMVEQALEMLREIRCPRGSV